MAAKRTTRRKPKARTTRSPKRSSVKKRHVVKRKGRKELFDDKKVYGSVYAAALNCHYSDRKSERIADAVTKEIKKWIRPKSSVTSHEIRAQTLDALKDDDVLLMYKHHLDLS